MPFFPWRHTGERMLQEFLSQLSTELDLPPCQLDEQGRTTFTLAPQVSAEIQDLRPGISLRALIGPCPGKRQEELFMRLSSSNYLGQMTGPTRIGLSADEKYLTLSLAMPYEMSYRSFRETAEDFFNFLLYWREEMVKFDEQKALV